MSAAVSLDSNNNNNIDNVKCCILYMHNLSKSWTNETIALLLGKQLLVEEDEEAKRNNKNGINTIKSTGDKVIRHLSVSPPSSNDKTNSMIRIHRMMSSNESNHPLLSAKLIFSSQVERDSIFKSYQGLAIPMTHGYHHFTFTLSLNDDEKETIDDDEDDVVYHKQQSCGYYSSAPTPPLHLQLLALSTDELERRIIRIHHQEEETTKLVMKNSTKPDKHNFASIIQVQPKKKTKRKLPRHCRVHRHAKLANELGILYNRGDDQQQRPIHLVKGVYVDSKYTTPVLEYLRSMTNMIPCSSSSCHDGFWPAQSKQRKGVTSGHYLTVRQSHPALYNKIWNLCKELFDSVIIRSRRDAADDDAPRPNYTALAITHNFAGSPHIDAHDTSYQHVVAVGDFSSADPDSSSINEESSSSSSTDGGSSGGGGGQLCVDQGPTVTAIDVHNKLGRLDGRNVHWVSNWTGERYSIVYYTTRKEHYTNPVEQSFHNQWMDTMNEQLKERE